MPYFRKPPKDKLEVPRGATVRFTCSAEQDGTPERPRAAWLPMSDQPCVGPERKHDALIGQVWDRSTGRRVWVVLLDGTARLVRIGDLEVLDEAEALALP